MSLKIIERELKEAVIPSICLFFGSAISFAYILPKSMAKAYQPGSEILCYLLAMTSIGLIFGIAQGTRLHPNPDSFYLRLPISQTGLFLSRFVPAALSLLTLQSLISLLLLKFPHPFSLELAVYSTTLSSFAIGRLLSRISYERTVTFFVGLAVIYVFYYLSHSNGDNPANYPMSHETLNFTMLAMFGFVSTIIFYLFEVKRPTA